MNTATRSEMKCPFHNAGSTQPGSRVTAAPPGDTVYHEYIGVPALNALVNPRSTNPWEVVFIRAHQCAEIAAASALQCLALASNGDAETRRLWFAAAALQIDAATSASRTLLALPPSEFATFRDLLRPASGADSIAMGELRKAVETACVAAPSLAPVEREAVLRVAGAFRKWGQMHLALVSQVLPQMVDSTEELGTGGWSRERLAGNIAKTWATTDSFRAQKEVQETD